MSERRLKRVLVVDDDLLVRNSLRSEFAKYNRKDGAFVFKRDPASTIDDTIDTASTIDAAIDAIKAKRGTHQYDVLVLDLSFDENGTDRSGLMLAGAFGLYRRLREEVPVVIVFSGFTELRYCVHTMRCGAWDMIDKRVGEGGENAYAQVVASAVSRLQALDLQDLLNDVAVKWVEQHMTELQTRYGGQVVAVWHEPHMEIVAAGKDVFDLEIQLEAWRRDRPEWMYPLIVRISAATDVSEANGAWR
jgi:DNA-binding NarL/FixJ family response regulator